MVTSSHGLQPTDQELIDFVIREARLIDQHRFEEWLDLFADDGIYWMPLEWGQTDPRLTDVADVRGQAAAHDPGRAAQGQPHLLAEAEEPLPSRAADAAGRARDEAANEYVTWTPMHYVETRLDEQELYAAWATHT